MIFQGQKGYIAQICEVWKQYNKMAVLHFFLVNFTLIYILFSLVIDFSLSYLVKLLSLSNTLCTLYAVSYLRNTYVRFVENLLRD